MPSSPYAVSVLDVSRQPGRSRDFEIEVRVPERIGNAVIGLPVGSEVSVSGRLESLHDGLLVSANVTGMLSGECVRCLADVTQAVQVEFQELFAYNPDEAFDYLVQEDRIDLEQALVDAVVPALPFQPVCEETCPGLCVECGVRLVEQPGHTHGDQIDPRWAALSALVIPEDADLVQQREE